MEKSSARWPLITGGLDIGRGGCNVYVSRRFNLDRVFALLCGDRDNDRVGIQYANVSYMNSHNIH